MTPTPTDPIAARAMLALLLVLLRLGTVNYVGHLFYVNFGEFDHYEAEWEAAHARGDEDGMWKAWHKEACASNHTLDPRGFFAPSTCP